MDYDTLKGAAIGQVLPPKGYAQNLAAVPASSPLTDRIVSMLDDALNLVAPINKTLTEMLSRHFNELPAALEGTEASSDSTESQIVNRLIELTTRLRDAGASVHRLNSRI